MPDSIVVQATQVSLDRPGRRGKCSGPKQGGRLDVDDRDVQRFGDGLTERAEHAQADERVGIPAGCVSVIGHLHHDRADHLPDRVNRLDRVQAAVFHELPPGVAGHDLLDIAAQGIKVHACSCTKPAKFSGAARRT